MSARRRRTNSGSERETSPYSGVQNVQRTYTSQNTASPSPPPALKQDRDMSCRDRTGEFLSAVKSMQSRQGNGHLNPRSNGMLQNRSEFMMIARKISRDIANTFAKLEKLTILANRKSLFDDKPVEIQELTYIVKQDIGSLNKQIAQLQELVKAQKNQHGRHKHTHSNTVVVALQSKLASMSNDFKSVLEIRTENMKQQKSRREQFSSQTPVQASMPPSAMSGRMGSVLLQDEYSNSSSGDVYINMDSAHSSPEQRLQLVAKDDSYIQSRADTMQNIEQTIVELGGIFQQLATMVKEQEEMVQRIDANVEETQLNVEAAHSEILKYFKSVSSNRWLMIKIFGVLIIFFIIFVVFMA